MKRSKSKGNESKEHKPDSVESVWEKAFGAMCAGLDEYGRYEILNILVSNSHRDRVCHELLTTYPGVTSIGEFLRNFHFNVKVSKRLFIKLQREHCIL